MAYHKTSEVPEKREILKYIFEEIMVKKISQVNGNYKSIVSKSSTILNQKKSTESR